MWERIAGYLSAEMTHQGFLLLQAAAIVGIVSIVLLLRRGKHEAFAPNYGVVLGIAGFALTWLVSDFIQAPYKPYLRNDLLFLAALIAGWGGGFFCLIMMLVARLLFAPASLQEGLSVAFDMSMVGLGGVAMHYWLKRRAVAEWGIAEALTVWASRIAVGLVSVMLTMLLTSVDTDLYARAFALRITSAHISLMILASVLVLFRYDARVRASWAAQLTQTRIDQLTQLPNRRALRDHLDTLFAAPTPTSPASHTLVLIEAQGLTDVLHVHGPEWGCKFWHNMAEALRRPEIASVLDPYRPQWFLFSDQTLAVVLHGITLNEVRDSNLLITLHIKLNDWLRESMTAPLPRLHYGVAEAAPEQATTDQLLRHLALSLRQDDQVVRYFRPALAERAELDERIRKSLLSWIENDVRVPLCYQPRFSLRNLQVPAAEALLRAKDTNQRPISALDVLEVAQRQNLLLEFEWATIRTAVVDVRSTIEQGYELQVAVNISTASLMSPGFGDRVVQLLKRSEIGGALLGLEITENAYVPDQQIVRDNVTSLHAAGIKLILDDFGTGHSALALLARLPFGQVKVDHHMVGQLADPRMHAAIALALQISQRYDAILVAEGVETEDQRSMLLTMGVEWGQGYLFSPAIPLRQLLDLIDAQQQPGQPPLDVFAALI